MITETKAEKLIATMPMLDGIEWNTKTKSYDDVQVKPHCFYRDNALYLSAESGDGAADYWGVGDDGPYINSKFEAWAEERGFYWEWENPGCLMLCGS